RLRQYHMLLLVVYFFLSSRRRHTRSKRDWSSDVCSSDLDITSYVVRDDATHQLLKSAYVDGRTIQAWEVDISEESAEGQYPATYMQGNLTNYNTSSGTDGYTELSTTFAVNLSPRDGEVTLTPEQFTAVQYAFHDFGALATEAGSGE